MGRKSTGVDTTNLPRLPVVKPLAEQTYQKRCRQLREAWDQLKAAEEAGNGELELIWKRAADALETRILQAGRDLPIPNGEKPEGAQQVETRAQTRNRETLQQADKTLEVFKQPADVIKAKLDEINRRKDVSGTEQEQKPA